MLIVQKKNFRWEPDMIDNLIKFIEEYKARMEFKNLDFGLNEMVMRFFL